MQKSADKEKIHKLRSILAIAQVTEVRKMRKNVHEVIDGTI
jgi:hypothetical protein